MIRTLNRVKALLLAFMLVLSSFPAGALAVDGMPQLLTNGVDLQRLYDNASDGAQILLSGTVELDQPLIFNEAKSVTITGTGTIQPADPNKWSSSTYTDYEKPYNTMIFITGGAAITFESGITIDGGKVTQCIQAAESTLWLNGCTIRNGKVTVSRKGAGIEAAGCTIHVGAETNFNQHFAEGGSATAGGALYMNNCIADIQNAHFAERQQRRCDLCLQFSGIDSEDCF